MNQTNSVTFVEYDEDEQKEIESLRNKLRIVDGAISIVKGQNKNVNLSTQKTQPLKPILKGIRHNDNDNNEKEYVTLGRKLLADMDQSYKIDTSSLQRVSCQLCGTEVDMSRIKSHEQNECKERKITCPEVGCGSVFPASSLKRHLAKECVTAKQRRKMAASAAIRKQRQDEEETTQPPPPPPPLQIESPRPGSVEKDEGDSVISLPVLCPDCKESMKSSILNWHLQNSCKMRKIYCPNRLFGCKAEIPFSLILQHVRSECEAEAHKDELVRKAKQRQEPVNCPACNELVPLDKLRRHEEQDCANRKVPCRNWCLGCTVQVRLRERKLHEEVDGSKSIRTALYFTGIGANIGINETDIVTPWTVEFWILRPNAEESAKSFLRNVSLFAIHFYEKFLEEVKIKEYCAEILDKLKTSTEISAEELQLLITELGIGTMKYEEATIETLGKAEVLKIALAGALNAIGELKVRTMDKIVSLGDIPPGEKEMRSEQEYERERKEMATKGVRASTDQRKNVSDSVSRPTTRGNDDNDIVENDEVADENTNNDSPQFDMSSNLKQDTAINDDLVKDDNFIDNNVNSNSSIDDEVKQDTEIENIENIENVDGDQESKDEASTVQSKPSTRPATTTGEQATKSRPPTTSGEQAKPSTQGNEFGEIDIVENDETADDEGVVEEKEDELAELFQDSFNGRVEELIQMARKSILANIDITVDGVATRLYSSFENEAKLMKEDKLIVAHEGLADAIFKILYASIARQNKLFKKSDAALLNTTMTWQQWKDTALVFQQLLDKDLEMLQRWRIELGLIQSDEIKDSSKEVVELSEDEIAKQKKKEKEQKRRDRKKKKALEAKKEVNGEEIAVDEDDHNKKAKLLPRIDEKIKSVQGSEILASSTFSSSTGGRCKVCLNINGKIGIVSTEGAVGSEFSVFSASVPREKWTHIALTCTKKPKNRINLFMNGELVGQVKDLAFPLPMGMIGAAPNENSFAGAILDVRYWRKVRSAQEIKLGCRRLVDVSGGRHRLVDTIDDESSKKPRRRPPKKKTANSKGIVKGGADLTSHGLIAWWTFEDGSEMKNCLSDITEFRFKTPIVASPISSRKDAATIGGCHGAGHMWLYADFIPVFTADSIVPIVNLDEEGGSLLPVPSFNARLKCPFELRRFRLSQSGRALQREVECTLGCGERMRKIDLRNHMRYECVKRTMRCRFEGCQATFLIEDQAQHERMYCSYISKIKMIAEIASINLTKIPCLLCSELIKQRDMGRHQSIECPHRVISCPHADCRKEIQAHLLEDHLNYSCESSKIKKRLWLIERARTRSNYARPWGFSITVGPNKSYNDSQMDDIDESDFVNEYEDEEDDIPLTFLKASMSQKYYRDNSVDNTDNEDTANENENETDNEILD